MQSTDDVVMETPPPLTRSDAVPLESSPPVVPLEAPKKRKTEKVPKAPRVHPDLGPNEAEVFCVSCREQVIIKDPKVIVNKKNVKMNQGICPKCGKRANRFIPNEKSA
jgi:hypothetical protein